MSKQGLSNMVFMLLLLCLMIPASAMGTISFWPATGPTGGGNALDGVSGNSIADGDGGFVVTTGGDFCVYVLDDDATCGGDSSETPCPEYVQPDTVGTCTNCCWMLLSINGDTVSSLPSTAPTITLKDSDAAAGTGEIYANSSGGSYDVILTLGVEDSGGEDQGYMELDGVTETIDFLQPVTMTTDLDVVDGGTGRSTGTTAYSLIATGTTATGAQQTLANGATTEILVGGGAAALPVWTTAEGSGAPVRATSPSLTTPNIGAATGTSLTLTGNLSGMIPGTDDGDGMASMASTDCDGDIYYNITQANTYVLPDAAAGLNVCFYATTAHAVTVRPIQTGDDHIYYEGTDCGEDDDLVGPATAGSFVCLHGRSATAWIVWGHANTWTCE